jgi:hypothetical protein
MNARAGIKNTSADTSREKAESGFPAPSLFSVFAGIGSPKDSSLASARCASARTTLRRSSSVSTPSRSGITPNPNSWVAMSCHWSRAVRNQVGTAFRASTSSTSSRNQASSTGSGASNERPRYETSLVPKMSSKSLKSRCVRFWPAPPGGAIRYAVLAARAASEEARDQ